MRAFLLLMALAASPAHALQDDGQIWLNWLATGSLSGNLIGHFDTSVRLVNDSSRLGQIVLRAGLGWRIRGDFAVQGGWFYTSNWPAGGAEQREHRSYQQATYTLGQGEGWSLRARTRVEQRFRLGEEGMGVRVRQQVRAAVDIGLPGSIRPFLAPEVMLMTTAAPGWGPRTGLEQVRANAGFTFPLLPGTATEIGYLMVWFPQNDLITHAMNLSLVTRF
jgi:hypothetical protein